MFHTSSYLENDSQPVNSGGTFRILKAGGGEDFVTRIIC
jgi:hypothetical protein